MNQTHKTLVKPRNEPNEYIPAIETQNEAMIGKEEDYTNARPNWQCDRANTIKITLGNNSGVLFMTGGESCPSGTVEPA